MMNVALLKGQEKQDWTVKCHSHIQDKGINYICIQCHRTKIKRNGIKIHTANGSRKHCSCSVIIKECKCKAESQWEVTRCQPKGHQEMTASAGKNVEKRELVYTTGRKVNWNRYENQWDSSSKMCKRELQHWPAMPRLGIYPRERNLCSKKPWEQSSRFMEISSACVLVQEDERSS